MSETQTQTVSEMDERRMMFLSMSFDGFGEIDIHEQASIYASAFGREEPNEYDYLAAFRDAVDAAMEADGA